MKNLLAILCFAFVLVDFALSVDPAVCTVPTPNQLRRRQLVFGDVYKVAGGNISAYAEVSAKPGVLSAVGVQFDKAVLANIGALPTCAAMFNVLSAPFGIPCPPDVPVFFFFLGLPNVPNVTLPFKTLRVDWLSKGHSPAGVYDVPHFDILFSRRSFSEVLTQQGAPGSCSDGSPNAYFQGNRPIPTSCWPTGVVNTGAVIPLGANFYVDYEAPEYRSGPVTHSYLWGGFNGTLPMWDVISSLSYLQDDSPSVCVPIPNYPEGFADDGYKPRCYCILKTADKVFVELRGFEWFEGGCSDPTYLSGWLLPSKNPFPACVIPTPETCAAANTSLPTPAPAPSPPQATNLSTALPASANSTVSAVCRTLISTTEAVLRDIEWPRSAEVGLATSYPLFADNIHGRVVPLGTFDDFDGAMEYFYSLTGPLTTDALEAQGALKVAKVVPRYIDCAEDHLRTSFMADFVFTDDTHELFTIQNVGFFNFNTEGKVCSYDWTLRRLGWAIEDIIVPITFATVDVAYQQICIAINTYCTGENQQYANDEDCVEFMKSIPFGTWDYADQNNFVCRNLHMRLVLHKPDVHCSHVGKTGGMKCVDKDYSDLINQDFVMCLNNATNGTNGTHASNHTSSDDMDLGI